MINRSLTGVTACEFNALAGQDEPDGPAIRDAPRNDGRVLGRLPAIKDKHTGFYGGAGELPEFKVIGFKDGWFLIEGAAYPEPYRPKLHSGRGWVAGNLLTTELLRNMLKQAPNETAADVVDPEVDGGAVSNPQSVKMRRIIACSGDWVLVDVALVKGMKPLLRTDAPAGAVRGWANGTCTAQLTTCDFDQSRPWSPPAPLSPQ